MTGSFERYLVDNNALFNLPPELRTSVKFRDVARLPSEVIHESGEYARKQRLDSLTYPTTARVLRHLKRVMATVAPDDRSLVDLFHYRGSADPFLVACALEANEAPAALLPVRWTVVTGDEAVIAKCREFDIPWCSAATFAALIDPVPVD